MSAPLQCPACFKPLVGSAAGSVVYGCGSTYSVSDDTALRSRSCLEAEKPHASVQETNKRTLKPETKAVTCPECSAQFRRAIVWWGNREFMADRGCLCDDCEKRRADAVSLADANHRHLALWNSRVPEDYHRADSSKVAQRLIPALEWLPEGGQRRLGLCGPPGAGKSMAAALCVKNAGIKFRWTNGFAARAIYNASVSGDGEARQKALVTWKHFLETPLLVIDDVDKGNFTEAWASALFDLLESRNGNCLPIVWTANHGPGALAKKMNKCGDPELADAIERRLCGGAKILTAK